MRRSQSLLDTSEELVFYKWKNGIKLQKPEAVLDKNNPFFSQNSYHTIRSIFESPLQVFLTNSEGIIQNANEITLNRCGFDSLHAMVGNSVRNIAKSESASFCLSHTHEVLQAETVKIKQGHYTSLGGDIQFQELVIKVPWYNTENKTVGILGFSIEIRHSFDFSNYMDWLVNMGLLGNGDPVCHFQTQNVEKFLLTPRELECLKLLLRGLTNKSIARHLGISSRTVEAYLNNIKTKTGISANSELAEKFFEGSHFLFRKELHI